ncbi:biotin-dependent carboxyltransferase [Marinobacterium sp. AK62]|uniref:Biotin-dependent carboxyltransferase n=1 Tax=Marinobacterium alkalitolerans TaxID=1542925 RepID=A0ABS3Z6P3_9GAMM|nr:biotin-dependent carboxyltransferase family protein [Marinobacterium alkalitolerans]MBP0047382.1 biotin-dependent carboxyltransferase [Marinobacterium alkalitolerans]
MNDMTRTGFKVRQPGLMTLIQDAGRFGQHHLGLTTGGPLDPDAFYWANRLCGNDTGSTCLEVSFGGLVLEAQVATRIAVTGANMPLKLNGREQECWRSHAVQPGDLVELGYATQGCRAYLAVAGGFQIPQQFGSTATVVREGIGGLHGSKLGPEDFLPCEASTTSDLWVLPEAERPEYGREVRLRVIPGYQQDHFDAVQQALFYSSEYTTTERSDRMGYRLEGQVVKADIEGILSEGICLGAIQVPADGQPIILLNDRQTIGGYPKLGSVFSPDLARLAQLTQGARVWFEKTGIDEAHNQLWLSRLRRERIQLLPA